MTRQENGHLDRRYRIKLLALFISLLIVTAAIIIGRQGQQIKTPVPDRSSESIERSGNLYMGIPARIEFVTAGAEAARQKKHKTATMETDDDTGSLPAPVKLDRSWALLADISDTFNAFDPFTELGKLNTADSTAPIDVSEDMASVVGISTTVSQMTRGAFDSTVKPLKALWKKARLTGQPPADADVVDAMAKTGWGYCKLLRTPENKWQVAKTRPGMQLDFGGIVKGWSVDRALKFLTWHKVTSALIQVGGEIGLTGHAPTGKPWRIGIRHPLEKTSNWTVLEIEGRTAVSTSGNYEQPVKVGNIDYYHIFDPRTGSPVDTDILGTTVVVSGRNNPNAIADGLATAFTVMGPDEALVLAHDLKGVEVLFIVRDKASRQLKEITTPGFNKFRP